MLWFDGDYPASQPKGKFWYLYYKITKNEPQNIPYKNLKLREFVYSYLSKYRHSVHCCLKFLGLKNFLIILLFLYKIQIYSFEECSCAKEISFRLLLKV